MRWDAYAGDAYGRDAYGRQARCLSPVAFAVPSALMVPVTTSLRFTGGPHRPRAGRNQGTLASISGEVFDLGSRYPRSPVDGCSADQRPRCWSPRPRPNAPAGPSRSYSKEYKGALGLDKRGAEMAIHRLGAAPSNSIRSRAAPQPRNATGSFETRPARLGPAHTIFCLCRRLGLRRGLRAASVALRSAPSRAACADSGDEVDGPISTR